LQNKFRVLSLLAIVLLSTALLTVVFSALVFINPNGTIEGFITDNAGSPIEGARILVGNFNATTDSSGGYSIKVPTDLLKNPLEINVSAQGYKTKNLQIQPTVPKTSCNATLEREFQTVTVTGNVTDGQGLPISGASIKVGNYSTTTSLNGSYLLSLPSGSYLIAATANGYNPFASSLNLNQQENTYNILLQRSAPVEVNPENTTYPLDSAGNIWDSTQIDVDSHPSDADTFLFLVRGITNTFYLRDLVGETYANGNWLLAPDASIADYTGGQLSHGVTNYTWSYVTNFEVQPLSVFGGFIPSVKNVNWVSLNSSLQYYVDQQVFFSEYFFTNYYNLSYTYYQFDENTLRGAEFNPDSRYLGIPSELFQKLQPLAMSITRNISSPFDQAVAIEDFLRKNYSYDSNYTQAPAGVDPVEWFLFGSKRGVCTHFNSAFVLLARSVGIPARLCAGYLIDATKDYQAVKPRQRHAYAEVLFKDIGWITFDATAPGSGGSTSESGPVFKIVYPTQGSYVSGQRITIEGVASGFYKSAKFSVSDPRFNLTYWNSEDEGDFAFDNSTSIEDGTYSVTIGITDASGNSASDTVTFTVGNAPTQVPTQTSITNCDKIGLKGSTFIVEGQVNDSGGIGVDNLDVLIYITKSKNESGRLCGQGKTKNGYFNMTCPVSKEIQVGNYLIIAHAVGNSQYQDSWSDPPISIMAETDLAVTMPTKVIVGRTLTVGGILSEKLTNQPLANETLLVTIGDQNYFLLTNDQGWFAVNNNLWEPGNYTVSIVFAGSADYLNSSFSGVTRVLGITMFPETSGILIRSENTNLTGRVSAENLPVDSEPLIITLNGTQIAATTTDSQGVFNVAFPVPSNQTLGTAVVNYRMQRYSCNATQDLAIMAKTSLICGAPEKLKPEDKFNVTVTLVDDHQQPIENMPTRLECVFSSKNVTSISNTTSDDGKTEYTNMTPPTNTAKNFTFTVSFAGDSHYLPSSYSGNVELIPRTDSSNMLLLILATSLPASATLLSALVWKRRKETSRNEPQTELETGIEESAMLTPSKKKADLRIIFPQISSPFPPVWGVNQPLQIRLELNAPDKSGSADLLLRIGEEAETRLETKGGAVETDRVFVVKGIHKLRAKFLGDDQWEETVAEGEIRIVDYREEIVDLFNSFFKSAKAKFQGVDDEMTARELQASMLSQVRAAEHDSLETVVSIFEVVDYSLHDVTRKDYERIYVALRQLEG